MLLLLSCNNPSECLLMCILIRWFHGRLSRHYTSSILMQNGKDGYFLVRQSEHNSGQLTLSVRGLDSVKHFSIVVREGGVYAMGRTIVFGTAGEMIKYFESQPVVSGESGVLTQLTHPYPREVNELVDYDTIRILTPYKTVSSPGRPAGAADLSVVLREGYLTKRGKIRKNWKTRWFVLGKETLKYYTERGRDDALGTIPLRECTAVEIDSTHDKLHCFRLVSPRRTLVMFASTQNDADAWVSAIQWKIVSECIGQSAMVCWVWCMGWGKIDARLIFHSSGDTGQDPLRDILLSLSWLEPECIEHPCCVLERRPVSHDAVDTLTGKIDHRGPCA